MDRLLTPTAVALVALLGGSAALTGTAPATVPTARDTIPPALSPFGAEHEVLLGEFAQVLRAVGPAAAQADRADFVRYLRSALLPHALIEERVLYRALDSVLETHGYATATMVLDHRTIARLTVELAAVEPGDAETFRRTALRLEALVENHFANEEAFVLPNLARNMKDRDLRVLLARMDAERVAQ